jgi:hypothetical protein
MAAPDALVRFVEPWSEFYGNSSLTSTVVVFGHLAALLFAGGLAVAVDRATLRAMHGDSEARARQLVSLRAAHRTVIVGLAVSAVTGVLLFAADVETYFVSPIFWTKMTLVALLLGNGFWMTRIESRIDSASDGGGGWNRLRRSAMVSVALWFATTFVGVALVNA